MKTHPWDSSEVRYPAGWRNAFVSRRSFWQIDPRIFLFTLSPVGTPYSSPPQLSRPSSPGKELTGSGCNSVTASLENIAYGVATAGSRGPFSSGSHLLTFFPPPPLQYMLTDGIWHPIRQKPPRQGEVFYIRYVPSVDQYLSFRVPVLPAKMPGLTMQSFHQKSASDISLLGASFPGLVLLEFPL